MGRFGVTLFGIFLTPVFFYVIRGLVGRLRKPAAAADAPARAHGVPAPDAFVAVKAWTVSGTDAHRPPSSPANG